MVLMNASKKARNAASMSNQTSHYGIMGGTVSLTGKTWAVRNALIRRGTYCDCIPPGPAAGLVYMKQKQLLSVNPQCTGGVGRLSNTRYGGCGKCNCPSKK